MPAIYQEVTGQALLLYIGHEMITRGLPPVYGIKQFDLVSEDGTALRKNIVEFDAEELTPKWEPPGPIAYVRWYPGNQEELVAAASPTVDPRLHVELRLRADGESLSLTSDFYHEHLREIMNSRPCAVSEHDHFVLVTSPQAVANRVCIAIARAEVHATETIQSRLRVLLRNRECDEAVPSSMTA